MTLKRLGWRLFLNACIWRKPISLLPVLIGLTTIGFFIIQDYGHRIESPKMYNGMTNSFIQYRRRSETNVTSAQLKQQTPKPNGYLTAELTQEACTNVSRGNPASDVTLRLSKQDDLMFCPLYKVSSTFWRRVFMIQREKKYAHLSNPYLISFDKDYGSTRRSVQSLLNLTVFKVVFTRDPYMRLFSTYVDKLMAPNPYFWAGLGRKIIKLTRPAAQRSSRQCGHDVTFPEFIKFVVHSLTTNRDVDPHFVQMHANCQPCNIKYDFVGKMENFVHDSSIILDKLNLKEMSAILKKTGSELAAQDAIKDTLKQPFSFKTRYIKCISFSNALNRAWTKLQIRGLIGNDSLTGIHDNSKITFDEMIKLANRSRAFSTSEIRSKIKTATLKDYWRRVDMEDKYKIRKLYESDFKLFQYDDTPDYVFKS